MANPSLRAILLLLGIALPAWGQSLRVQLTETRTQRPLTGALVDILDSTSAVAVQGVLGDGGRRAFRLPRHGTYRVRLRRIGYDPFVGAPVVVGPAGADFAQEVPGRRVVLAALTVSARARCARDAFSDPAFASLWEEVRKALLSTMLGREAGGFSLEMRPFRRRLNRDLDTEVELVGLPRVTTAARPYVAASADELSQSGYIRGTTGEMQFFAPDEQVLLSDRFIEDHCFTAVRGENATDGQLGVRFVPAERRRTADIAGTIWLDSASAELRTVNFWYVLGSIPPGAAGEERSGGQILFDRTPQGSWMVSAWRLRMPRFDPARLVQTSTLPDWYEETGGVVTPPRGDTLPPAPVLIPYRALLAPARVTGTIFDSLGQGPLVGARVWAAPIESAEAMALGLVSPGRLTVEPRAGVTDASGRYAIENLPAGDYRVGFEHPVLDSLAVLDTRYDVRLRPGGTVVGDLSVPSLATFARGCVSPAGVPASLYGGLLTGIVRGAGDDRPLENAVVHASWMDFSGVRSRISLTPSPATVEVRTDSAGLYRICGIPDSAEVALQAVGPHSSTGPVEARIGSSRLARVNLRLAEVADGEPPPAPSGVAGTVSDSAGRPVSGATVTVVGTAATTVTDATGQFRLGGVMAGSQTVEVRRVGLDPGRLAIDLVPGATAVVHLALTRVHLLDALTISATRSSASPRLIEAARRRRLGTGHFIAGEAFTGATSLQSMVRDIPGVRTSTTPDGQWVAVMRAGGGGSINNVSPDCVARVFVDGRETTYDVLGSYAARDIAGVEVYVRAGTAPLFTTGRSPFGDERCGVILFWTIG